MNQPATAPAHAARLHIEYPEEGLNRLSTALRLLYMAPVAILIGLVGRGVSWEGLPGEEAAQVGTFGGGVLVLPLLLTLVFRHKYPHWWFDFNLHLARFTARVLAYMTLLTDRYPSTDEEQSVHLDLDYPDARADLNRWLPLVKWFLAIPHYVVLLVLVIGAVAATVIAWFAVLFTGRYPRPLFGFVEGVLRWKLRVEAYALLLITDRYPPFSLA